MFVNHFPTESKEILRWQYLEGNHSYVPCLKYGSRMVFSCQKQSQLRNIPMTALFSSVMLFAVSYQHHCQLQYCLLKSVFHISVLLDLFIIFDIIYNIYRAGGFVS